MVLYSAPNVPNATGRKKNLRINSLLIALKITLASTWIQKPSESGNAKKACLLSIISNSSVGSMERMRINSASQTELFVTLHVFCYLTQENGSSMENPAMVHHGPTEHLSHPPLKRLFLCYCREDLRSAKRLQVHLAGCQSMHQLAIWDSTRLFPGSSWRSHVSHTLASAQVAVMLVSADFLATPLIVTYELPSLLEAAQTRGTHIFPVILSPCLFEESPLAPFQPVNPGQPLNLLSCSQRDTIWVTLVRAIVSVLTFLI
jgi:hypothetical protein